MTTRASLSLMALGQFLVLGIAVATYDWLNDRREYAAWLQTCTRIGERFLVCKDSPPSYWIER